MRQERREACLTVYVVARLKEHDRREIQQVQTGLDQIRIADQDVDTAIHLIENPVFAPGRLDTRL
jgi:hypothetical protein